MTDIQIRSFDVHLAHLQTRMPFRYGIATMTRVPLVFVGVGAEIDGQTATGVSSDLLAPKWFTKDPDKPLEIEVEEMLGVIRQAGQFATGLRSDSPFRIWADLYSEQEQWAQQQKVPPLLAHFGTSLVERALLEAVCRAAKQSFQSMLHTGRLGVQLEAVHSELRGKTPADLLPAKPLPRITIRHTVGLSDPLTAAEIPAEERLSDGLPQALDDCIRHYRLKHFKVKVCGRLEQDLERLERVAAVVEKEAPADSAFSLDGNEQFTSLGAFREFWEAIHRRAALRSFFRRLLFVEQPLRRDLALQPGLREEFAAWPECPPMIIDESDARVEDLRTALDLGYAGTSHKNCKGVFKGVAHACLIAHRQAAGESRRFLMSGEDLCNVGPVALLQDLAVMATLGIQSVERNGHHYHAGLSQLPAEVQEQILQHHSDLYERSAQGFPILKIRDGEVVMNSVNAAPFGVGFPLNVEPLARAS